MPRPVFVLLGTLGLILTLIVAVRVYDAVRFIDAEVTSGEGWGVAVGSSPAETLERLKFRYSDEAAVLGIYREQPPKFEVVDRLSDVRASQLKGASKIVVLGTNAAVSELTIEFEREKVVRIHMRQRAFDL